MNAGRDPISEELDVLKTVTRRLREAGIPYMVTGSIAMNFYAIPRMTRDIDIVVELDVTDVDRIVDLFKEEFYLEREAVMRDATTMSRCNLIHTAFLIKVDFVIRKNTEYRHKEFSRRRQIRIGEEDLFFVTPEELNDVRNLIATVPDLDRRHLAFWAAQLGIEELYREVTQ